MNRLRLFSALGTGFLTGGLFLVVTTSGLGFFFMFLAMLPILMAGLSRSALQAFDASAVAALLLALIGGWEVGAVFILFFAVPAWYISFQAGRSYVGENRLPTWHPIGLIITDLALYACVIMGGVVLHYALYTQGVHVVLESKIREAFTELPAGYAPMLEQFATAWSFLVFAMLSWMWVIGFYLNSWLANRILAKQNRIKRASLAVEIFAAPHWLLYLLAVAALASLIGSPSMQFFGKACFITLLLPYFFLGLALVHAYSQKWAMRGLLLFLLYFMLLSQLWFALIIATFGLIYHVKQLNKGLPPGQISPK